MPHRTRLSAISLFLGFSLSSCIPRSEPLRFIALGDSYTIGEGVTADERWPNLLTQSLQRRGISVELVANPSRTGWTTQQLIAYELPVARREMPNLLTVMIGVNDLVQGASAKEFQTRLNSIVEQCLDILKGKRQLVLVTIPDFLGTPVGAQYARSPDTAAKLQEFNRIIVDTAEKHRLPVADIFELSRRVTVDPSLIAADGLHPSAAQYRLWLPVIEDAVVQQLRDLL